MLELQENAQGRNRQRFGKDIGIVMDYTASTISNPLSKYDLQEALSMTFASLQEAARRQQASGGMAQEDAISNERIKKGDTLLDTYEVVSNAISGGMGSVWRVHHTGWDRDLAMKRPHPRYFAEGSRLTKEGFIRECENWIRLGLHPHIVSCFYVREIGGLPTVFSEWMSGGSLRDCIQDGSLYTELDPEVRRRTLNPAPLFRMRVLDIAIQILRGIRHAHSFGLVHQDIKPGNILLSSNWDAKVTDFGLAKARAAADGTSSPSGYTPEYCPREQCEGAAAEPWMDVYSWALTVLEMFAGRRLWKTGAEASDPENLQKWFEQCTIRPDRSIAELLTSCLTGPPDTRLTDFDAIEAELIESYEFATWSTTKILSKYDRKEPQETWATASALNNMALSFLDLGMPDRAEQCWQEALAIDPRNADAAINRALWLWRNGVVSDHDVHDQLEAVKEHIDYETLQAELDAERRTRSYIFHYPEPVRGHLSVRSMLNVYDAQLDGSVITFWANEIDRQGIRNCICRFDVMTGALAEKREDSRKCAEIPYGTASSRYCQPYRDGLQISIEVSKAATDQQPYPSLCFRDKTSGRAIATLTLPEIRAYYFDKKDRYPQLLSDPESGMIVLYRSGEGQEFAWFPLPQPLEAETSEPMAYQVSNPLSYQMTFAQEKLAEIFMKRFREAMEADRQKLMLTCYDESKKLPHMQGNPFQAEMNEELMRRMQPVGFRGLFPLRGEQTEPRPWTDIVPDRMRDRGEDGEAFIRTLAVSHRGDVAIRLVRDSYGGVCAMRRDYRSGETDELMADPADGLRWVVCGRSYSYYYFRSGGEYREDFDSVNEFLERFRLRPLEDMLGECLLTDAQLSLDEEKLLLASMSQQRSYLLVYDLRTGDFRVIYDAPGGKRVQFLAAPDFRFLLVHHSDKWSVAGMWLVLWCESPQPGAPGGPGSPAWNENTAGSRQWAVLADNVFDNDCGIGKIRRISVDGCYLLDDTCRRRYALCWEYDPMT